MKALKVSCTPAAALSAIILFSAAASFAGEITKDDIQVMKDSVAAVQKSGYPNKTELSGIPDQQEFEAAGLRRVLPKGSFGFLRNLLNRFK